MSGDRQVKLLPIIIVACDIWWRAARLLGHLPARLTPTPANDGHGATLTAPVRGDGFGSSGVIFGSVEPWW